MASSSTANSYYVLTGLTPSTQYYLAATSLTSAVNFWVTEDLTTTFAVGDRDCNGDQWGATSGRPRHCIATANANGELFVELASNNASVGANFQFYVTTPLPVSEGVSVTVDVTGALPYRGEVEPWAVVVPSSFYRLSGLTLTDDKLVRLTDISDDIDLYVYSASDFTGLLCSSAVSGIAESCEVTNLAVTEIFIEVRAGDDSTATHDGALFTLDVIDPPVSEGTVGSPVNITGLMPYSGTQDTTNDSFYVIEGLTPGSPYSVSMTNVTGGGALFVYSTADFATTQECTSLLSVSVNPLRR